MKRRYRFVLLLLISPINILAANVEEDNKGEDKSNSAIEALPNLVDLSLPDINTTQLRKYLHRLLPGDLGNLVERKTDAFAKIIDVSGGTPGVGLTTLLEGTQDIIDGLVKMATNVHKVDETMTFHFVTNLIDLFRGVEAPSPKANVAGSSLIIESDDKSNALLQPKGVQPRQFNVASLESFQTEDLKTALDFSQNTAFDLSQIFTTLARGPYQNALSAFQTLVQSPSFSINLGRQIVELDITDIKHPLPLKISELISSSNLIPELSPERLQVITETEAKENFWISLRLLQNMLAYQLRDVLPSTSSSSSVKVPPYIPKSSSQFHTSRFFESSGLDLLQNSFGRSTTTGSDSNINDRSGAAKTVSKFAQRFLPGI